MADQGSSERDWTKRYRLAAGIYAMRGGQILLLERARGMMIGFWSVPGGIVDPGESPPEAAARELFEEAGLTPTGPLWLVTAVPLQGYGRDLLSLRYAGPCDAGDVFGRDGLQSHGGLFGRSSSDSARPSSF